MLLIPISVIAYWSASAQMLKRLRELDPGTFASIQETQFAELLSGSASDLTVQRHLFRFLLTGRFRTVRDPRLTVLGGFALSAIALLVAAFAWLTIT